MCASTTASRRQTRVWDLAPSMSISVDVYALPKLPSMSTRGPTRICTCMLVVLLLLVLVALAPSLVGSMGSDGVTVIVPTATGEAPLPLPLPLPLQSPLQAPLPRELGIAAPQVRAPAAALRFARARAQWQKVDALRNDPDALGALARELGVVDHSQARLIADAAQTLGWLVERAQTPR